MTQEQILEAKCLVQEESQKAAGLMRTDWFWRKMIELARKWIK